MRIGIDFDDVIFDLAPEFIRFQNTKFGTDFTFEGHFAFLIEDVWNISREEAIRRVHDFVTSPLHRSTAPVAGAKEAIFKLQQQHDLFIVTGRSCEHEVETLEWIRDHLPAVFKEIIFTNHFSDLHKDKKVTKAEACASLNLHFLVEDVLLHAEDVAKTNTHVLLLDKPWNQNAMHTNMTRVHSWHQIEKILLP